MSEITRILLAIEGGDPAAAESLLPLVYDELRKLAACKMNQEKPGQTLQATALVHEAFIRLVSSQDSGNRRWNGRGHFFAAAAEAMRRILVEAARRRTAAKRGGGAVRCELFDIYADSGRNDQELLAIHDLLGHLQSTDALAAELVKLRFFAGLTMAETAASLEIPPRPSVRLSTSEGLPSLAARRAIEPHKLASLLRGELDWIVMKSLEKDRNRRYATVNGLAEDVQRFLVGEPVLAHPPSSIYRLKKLARRNWRAFTFAALVCVLLAGVTAVGLIAARKRQFQISAHSALVSSALEQASEALGFALGAPIGGDAEWIMAREKSTRLLELLELQAVDSRTQSRAAEFIERYAQADADRKLAEQIENVVILSATHEDLQSWQRMEANFRELFLQNGIELDALDPQEVATRIRAHRSARQLSDALELWIGTRGQMATLGGPRLTAQIMQPWADAMVQADPDPVRNSIRRLIYAGKRPTLDEVDAAVAGVQLKSLSARTLSWLATVFSMAGASERSDEVFRLALHEYPSDFMLNFDFAYVMAQEQRWAGAIRYFLRCTAIRPDVAGVWHALGNAFRENGELELSKQALQSSIELEPDHAPIHVDLAQTLLAVRDFASAESSARKAIQLGSQAPNVYFVLGRALMEQQRYAEALVALQQCAALGAQQPSNQVATDEWIDRCRKLLLP